MVCDKARALELLHAARVGDLARVRSLVPPCGDLAADAVPDAPDGVTPLMAAAAGGHERMVELLLQLGADAARRDVRGRSAAYHARGAGHPHLAERLDTVVDKEKTIW
ncbi:ankyrin repeat domain-containing protein [Falsiroseomonas sp.]|uniref:ankyrin repeat domain-containing protein n=1 Tax=Falsiroseomonas sp. TaxID=2870721 RepID=UPI0035642156